jgi:hypothetical protein
MKKILLLLLFILAGHYAHAATCATINSGQGQSSWQSTINSCGSGNTVALTAGTYTVSSPLQVPCGVSMIGPVATPATAIITYSSPVNNQITQSYGACSAGNSFQYISFNNAGGIYFDPTNHQNIVIEHNQFTSIPYFAGSGLTRGITFDGNINNTDTNVTVEYNTIGDGNSCNQSSGMTVDDGACAGLIVSQANMTNFVMRYNLINHVQEGTHFFPSNYGTGTNPTAQCDSCDLEYNSWLNIHRIALEFQTNVTNHPVTIENNYVGPPLNPYYNTLTFSIPCCQNQYFFNVVTNVLPSDYVSNNVLINNLGEGNASPFGVEDAGTGNHVDNNLIQGNFCLGVTWSYVEPTQGTISNNTMQGQPMSDETVCTTSNSLHGGFITSENTPPFAPIPAQVGNVLGATPVTVTSITPAISPAAGSQSFPLSVTLTDPGYTSGPQPLGNTGIWYTIDGSTPVPGAGTATYIASGSSFMLPAAATVKAVGMWGTPPQPTSHPTGYGFTPSAVVSTVYSGGPPVVATPIFSPAPQIFTSNISVSISTTTPSSTIYYTTDGSTPTTSSSVYTGPLNLTATTTIKAFSTASGLTNSPVTTGTYSLKTFTSVSIATTGGVTSVATGVSNQLIPKCSYSDGSSDGCTSLTVTYTTSSPTIVSLTTGGLATGGSVGSSNLKATVLGISSNTIALSVTGGVAPTLTSCNQGNATNQNQFVVGQSPVNQQLFCFYGGVTPTITNNCTTGDIYGNGPTAWSSSDVTKGTVIPLGGTYPNFGVVTPVAAGTFNSQAAIGSVTCSPWTWTVTNPVLQSIALTATGGVTSLTPPNVVKLIATGTYNNGTTANITSSITTWTSTNPSAATINSTGTVMAVAAGSPTFTATYSGVTSTPPFPLTISIAPPPTIVNNVTMGSSKLGGKVKTQ